MKKYIFSLVIFCLALTASIGQVSANFTGSDTVVNTATVDIGLTVSGAYNTGAFQVVVTKVSGTVAGNAILQGSVDGINYVNIDTLATSNVATQTKIFTESPVKYPFYKVSYTGSGTMAAIISSRAHFKGKL